MSMLVDFRNSGHIMEATAKRPSEDCYRSDIKQEVNGKSAQMEIYRAQSRSPSPPPSSDSLSNLHRVTDMLKDKINNVSDLKPAQDLSDRKSSHSVSKATNGCLSNNSYPKMDSYPLTVSTPSHHMSVLLGSDVFNNQSNVLRGILQGRERLLADQKRFSEMYQRQQDADRNESLGGESVDSFMSGSRENLTDDSDPEQNENGVSDLDDFYLKANNNDSFLSKQEVNSENTDDEHQDDKRSFGADKNDAKINQEGKTMMTERRPKRKQYIPQQHGSQEPSPKIRKIEQDILQKQLKHMQDEITLMQQRYCDLYNQSDSYNEDGIEKSRSSKLSAFDKEKGKLLSSLDFDPSQFIKEASQLVQDQEFFSTDNESPAPTNIASLAKMLKDEITNSVGTLVDSVVSKFVEKHQKLLSNSSLQKSPVSPQANKPKKARPASPANEPIQKSRSPSAFHNNNNNNNVSKEFTGHSKFSPLSSMGMQSCMPKPPRTKVTDKITHPFFDFQPKPFAELMRAHPALFPPPPYFHAQIPQIQPLYAKEPEQTEPMALVVGTPSKKKRTKVTDTRLSPRAARALLQESMPHPCGVYESVKSGHFMNHGHDNYSHPPLIPISLPTSVAIPNPSLQQSDILAMYSNSELNSAFSEMRRGRSPSLSPAHTPMDMHQQMKHDCDAYEQIMQDSYSNYNNESNFPITSTLTPMHLRKAKLMFFYTRYPSSSILKIYFPDVKFNKNNTAQLVKWFSNFREFFYIQMEKYSRQALAEGVKNAEDLVVNGDSELYRILNLHYNRNNQIEVPDAFRVVVQAALREFFRAIQVNKDAEQSWKKAIYKVIARLDDTLPEYFKSPNWMEQLNDS